MNSKIFTHFTRLPLRRKNVGILIFAGILFFLSFQLFDLYNSNYVSVPVQDQQSLSSGGSGKQGTEKVSQEEQYDDFSDYNAANEVIESSKEFGREQYLTELFSILVGLKPNFDALPEDYPKAPSVSRTDKGHPVYSWNYLKEAFMKVTDDQIQNLRENHHKFFEKVKDKSSVLYENVPKLYNKGTKGMVYVGGGKYSWFSLLSIKHIREIGSELPAEVFIPSEDEYEEQYCEEILPKLNAKCIKVYDILDLDVVREHKIKIKGFMLKSLAILLSSFEDILLLDADNIPYLNPDALFSSLKYNETKFVLWPDYWQRTTHPAFFQIQEIDIVKLNLNVPDPVSGEVKYTSEEKLLNDYYLHDLKGTMPDPATESGQLMISKKDHYDIIILSFYYNFYGPNYYYHLLTQWAPGQGDKETFLAAANLLHSKFYQEKTPVRAIGTFQSGDFRGTAQGQHFLMEKHLFSEYQEKLVKIYKAQLCSRQKQPEGVKDSDKPLPDKPSKAKDCELTEDSKKALKEFIGDETNAKLMFMHNSTPKFDPISLVYEGDVRSDFKHDGGGHDTKEKKRFRFYEQLADPGYYNFEKMQWDNIYEFLCSKDKSKLVSMKFINKQIEHYGEQYDHDTFCSEIKDHINWLFLNEK